VILYIVLQNSKITFIQINNKINQYKDFEVKYNEDFNHLTCIKYLGDFTDHKLF